MFIPKGTGKQESWEPGELGAGRAWQKETCWAQRCGRGFPLLPGDRTLTPRPGPLVCETGLSAPSPQGIPTEPTSPGPGEEQRALATTSLLRLRRPETRGELLSLGHDFTLGVFTFKI